MTLINIREWPRETPYDINRREGALIAARLVINAILTAPVTGGVQCVECALAYGEEEKEKIARKMEELAYRPGKEGTNWQSMCLYEAVMVRQSDAVIFTGSINAHQHPFDAGCGACGGRRDCSFLYTRVKSRWGQIDTSDRRSDTLIKGPLCAAHVSNFGFCVGGGLRMAEHLHVDCRPFVTVGMAGLQLGYLPKSSIVVGMPIAVLAKSPYVDVPPEYHLMNEDRLLEELRQRAVISRQFGAHDYRKWDPSLEFVYAPCEHACPVHVDSVGYIAKVSQGDFEGAINLIRRKIPLAGVIGYCCPHPCEEVCKRGELDDKIAINALKRAAVDYAAEHKIQTKIPIEAAKEEKVAIVGSGPAGLNAAFHLVRKGYKVTVFEAGPVAGGIPAQVIPEYRLPTKVLEADLEFIRSMGIEVKTNTPVGKDLSLAQIKQQGYKAIFIAVGAGAGQKLNIPGEESKNVMDALTFLKNRKAGEKLEIEGKKVLVIGGGQSAIDSARTALRLGAREVCILYRRTKEEMPAYQEDVESTEEEGVIINYLIAPTKIVSKNGKVTGLECQHMQLGEVDETGRRQAVPRRLPLFKLDCDVVIAALGQIPMLGCFAEEKGLGLAGACVSVDPVTLATSMDGVFAGGDVTGLAGGSGSVVEAMAAGERAARFIDKYLRGEPMVEREIMRLPEQREEIPRAEDVARGTKRVTMATLTLEERIKEFKEVEKGYSEDNAVREAKRCIRCDLERGASRFLFANPISDKPPTSYPPME